MYNPLFMDGHEAEFLGKPRTTTLLESVREAINGWEVSPGERLFLEELAQLYCSSPHLSGLWQGVSPEIVLKTELTLVNRRALAGNTDDSRVRARIEELAQGWYESRVDNLESIVRALTLSVAVEEWSLGASGR